MTRYVVAAASEIAPGARLIVEVEGRSICVFNVAGQLFAIRNRCPHQGGPLCRGELVGAVESVGPGDYTYDASRQFIRCPWHGWEFDLKTGESLFDPRRVRVRSYETQFATGEALAEGSTNIPEPGRLGGPFRAETYEVAMEEEYVVLDMERR